ncbi:MAG: hypothetical protein ACYS1A_10890 [Planctomycetota bacterium]|jgi:hypothetical protein
MARNRKKMSLYEVIRTAEVKPDDGKVSAQPQQGKADKDKAGAMPLAGWPRKPRIVQLNAGRVEFSLPYQLAIAVLLGVVVVILLVYRLGRVSVKTTGALATETVNSVQKIPAPAAGELMQNAETAEEIASAVQSVEEPVPVKSKGNNNIVITQYRRRMDLVPVQEHFALKDIETEIVTIDDWYFLRTVDKYENPERPGTNGYAAREKIIKWGAEYKAQAGYETFGAKPFQDAYGRNFSISP